MQQNKLFILIGLKVTRSGSFGVSGNLTFSKKFDIFVNLKLKQAVLDNLFFKLTDFRKYIPCFFVVLGHLLEWSNVLHFLQYGRPLKFTINSIY